MSARRQLRDERLDGIARSVSSRTLSLRRSALVGPALWPNSGAESVWAHSSVASPPWTDVADALAIRKLRRIAQPPPTAS